MKVAIRADGGPSIGFGHLIRTSTIATECLHRGDTVLYFTTTPDNATTVLPEPISVKKLDSTNDPTEIIRMIEKNNIDSLFIDLFEADTEYQRALSQSNSQIIVRHNYLNHTVCCDALVYGDLHAPTLDYEWLGSKPEFLLGSDYVLLREQFRKVAQKKSNWRANPNRALITMGGSDVSNTTPDAMEAFYNFDGTVDVIIGPGFTNREEIERTAESLPTRFNLLQSPNNIANLMHRADVAVTTCGGTVFELLATRTPFVGLPLVENQQQRAAALQNRELALIADEIETVSQRIDELLAGGYRKRLYDRIEGVVDGDGARRVYDAMCRTV